MREPVTGEDLRVAAAAVRDALAPLAADSGADWTVPAEGLEWTCLRTLDHIVDALMFYAGNLATRSSQRRSFLRDGAPSATPAQVLGAVEQAAAVLAGLAEAAPPGTRAFHPAGMADTEGFLAMACDEALVHGDDVARGLGATFAPPRGLPERVLARLFPWVTPAADEDPWAVLRWANGRTSLLDRGRLGPDWWWHCAPLEEWDGRPRVRTAPPAWT